MKDWGTGRSRGFGFVTFDDAASVDRVLDGGPHHVSERKVEVKKAIAKPTDMYSSTTQAPSAVLQPALAQPPSQPALAPLPPSAHDPRLALVGGYPAASRPPAAAYPMAVPTMFVHAPVAGGYPPPSYWRAPTAAVAPSPYDAYRAPPYQPSYPPHAYAQPGSAGGLHAYCGVVYPT